MKSYISVIALVVICCLFMNKLQAQSCTLQIAYNANLATEADFQANQTLLTSCIESYLLTNNGLVTTITFVSVTGGNSPVVTLEYALSSPADSAIVTTATTGGAVPFGFGVINCLSPNAIDGFGFTASFNTISPVNCGSVSTVPTLSQWGLILLALCVVSFGVVSVWKKQNAQTWLQD